MSQLGTASVAPGSGPASAAGGAPDGQPPADGAADRAPDGQPSEDAPQPDPEEVAPAAHPPEGVVPAPGQPGPSATAYASTPRAPAPMPAQLPADAVTVPAQAPGGAAVVPGGLPRDPAVVPGGSNPSAPVSRSKPRRAAAARHRSPLLAFPAMIVFGLLAAFFAWQAAEPLWLAVGRGVDGHATEARCDATDRSRVEPPAAADRPTYPCVVFTEASGAFEAVDVDLRGAGTASRPEGTTVAARMMSPDRGRAYVANPAGLHLRWSIGLALVVACAAGVAWSSGATRLDPIRSRRRAVALSLAGPLLLAAGILAATL